LDSEFRDALTNTDVLRWWRYKLPRPLESRYVSETDADRNHQIRFWVAVGLAFSWVNCLADMIVVPDVRWLAFLLRLGVCTPVAVLAIWVLRDVHARGWLRLVATAVPPAVSLLSVLIVFAASTSVDTFRPAVVLSIGILWMNVLIPMRLGDAMAFTLATLTIGEIVNFSGAAAHHAAIDHPEIIVMTQVLVGLSIVARFLAERESRHGFLRGLRLKVRADDLMRSNTKLLEMANTDPLTGLANRRFFDQALAVTWDSARATRSPLSILMIDVDHFKSFNDSAGHLAGDRCLTIVARAIGDQMRREHDFAARFGGEEFVVLMPATDDDAAVKSAERVRAAIGSLRVFHPGRIGRGFVSVSIGVASMDPAAPDGTPAALLAAADQAMYAAKTSGRDRVVRANGLNLAACVAD
jgi:diguanylate cyclase (GGDEF)-like protein